MKRVRWIFAVFCCTFCFLFVGCKNENKTSLATPEIISIQNAEIVFSQVENAGYYALSINGMVINIDVEYGPNVEIIDNKVHYDASKIMVVGEEYAIKLQAKATDKYESNSTEVKTYVYTPVATTPENVKIENTTLTWDAVKNATSYIVKVENSKLDDNGVIELDSKTTETYTFSTNKFNFSSLTALAGKYNFYVASVYTDGENYSVSEYSEKSVYTKQKTLTTPKISALNVVGNELIMTAVVDDGANEIELCCNGKTENLLLNGTASSITKSGNILTINLSEIFEDCDFLSSSNFEFKIKANFQALSEDLRFYLDSDWSQVYSYCQKSTLDSPAPILYGQQLNWTAIEGATKYKLIVLNNSNYQILYFDSDITSFELPTNTQAILIQAVGTKNVNNSKYDFVLVSGSELNLSNISVSNYVVSWVNINQDYAFVVSQDEICDVTTNQYTYSQQAQKQKNYYSKLIVVKNGNVAISDISLTNNTYKLTTPTISATQGFASSSQYEFSFSGVENALGYKIKLIKADNGEFEINKIYTSTVIDLSQYLKDAGEDIKYVKVKAVADEFSNNLDSDYSVSVEVVKEKSLATPTFYSSNGVTKCVLTETQGETTKYYLAFYGVENAYQYEVLINYSLKTITASTDNPTKLYKLDITNYLTTANRYDFSLRAIADPTSTTLKSSGYVYASFSLKMQLSQVKNIAVVENNGIYTLSFEHVSNAKEYQVRIVKLNDYSYSEYLSNKGLDNPFTVVDACQLPEAFLQQSGKYYVYMTAIPDDSGYYATGNESQECAIVEKLTTLKTSTDLQVVKGQTGKINLSFKGDNNADFYEITVIDANNFETQFNYYDNEKSNVVTCNIAEYIESAGDYQIRIRAKVSSSSENAKAYESGATAEYLFEYRLTSNEDFARYKVVMYNTTATNYIEDADDLKIVLWYNYLYELDADTKLSIKLKLNEVDDETTETPNDAIKRIANECTEKKIYSFGSDEAWINMQLGSTDDALLKYLVSKILSVYPEINSQSEIQISQNIQDTSIFTLYYKNTLNGEKTFDSRKASVVDFGGAYSYLNNSQRRASTTVFALEENGSYPVETTEQLMYAVQNNKRPEFYGESDSAETVYANAKAVLLSCVSTEMTDMEKATAIFDWIEHAVNNNSMVNYDYLSEPLDVSAYGKFADYYLETIFLNLQNGNATDGEFNLGDKVATAEAYSKAFTLLCRIEGLEAVVVHGTRGGSIAHTWNKIKIDNVWYVVDLLLSDNLLASTNTPLNSSVKGTANSSHTYFMVSTSFQNSMATIKEIDQVTTANCTTNYDYYGNAEYTLSKDQANSFGNLRGKDCEFIYSKEYNSNGNYRVLSSESLDYKFYSSYFETYLINLILLAKYQLQTQSNVCLEIKVKQADNQSGSVLSSPYLRSDITSILSRYGNTQPYLAIMQYNSNYYHNYIYNSTSEYFVILLYFKA